MIDFDILSEDSFSTLARKNGLKTFEEACKFVSELQYGRISDKEDFTLILTEKKGTCSSKHAFLAGLVDENKKSGIDLMVGIYFINAETHPEFQHLFENKSYPYIPDAHCYFRVNGNRYDYTFPTSYIDDKNLIFIREQKIEPHQATVWKEAIHQDFIKSWLVRNPHIKESFEEIWKDRESLISKMK